jgi:hypothetical protein
VFCVPINTERVWKAEQDKEQERKKTELLRKQMMEEREMDEMRRLQGRDPSKEKLAWMYAPVGIQNDADEYLMGKPKEPVLSFAHTFCTWSTRWKTRLTERSILNRNKRTRSSKSW